MQGKKLGRAVRRHRTNGIRYIAAGLICVAATILQQLFSAWLAPLHFILYFTAVTLSSIFFGVGPALFSIALSCALADFYFLGVPGEFALDSRTLSQLAVFSGNGVLITFLGSWIARRDRHAEADRARLLFVERISDGFFSLNQNWEFTYLNDPCARILGIERMRKGAVVGRRIWNVLPPHVDLAFGGKLREFLATQTPAVFSVEDAVHRLWLEVSTYPSEDGIAVFVRDVSSRKEFERELRRHASELQEANVDLARSNSELAQFADIASHDLREPLRNISIQLQILQRELGPSRSETVNASLDMAIQGAKRLYALIHDLLAHSRIRAQEGPASPIPLEIVVQEALQNLQSALAETEAEVQVDPLPTVSVNPAQFVSVFQNLVGNALKYRSEAKPRIEIKCRQKSGDWMFSVCDNGIGIDSQHHERVFTLFRRVHPKERYPGNGIGLAICKKVIEIHGGRIWVDSALGRGATFHFTLPESNTPS